MTLRTKVIGRNQTDHGPWVPGTVAGKKFHYQLFGCDWESLHDNNNTAPAVWDGGDVITPNLVDWKKVSGSYEAWLMNKDKPATTGTTGAYPYNGMGRVVLKKNIVEGVNTLTHEAFEDSEGNDLENTIYVIQYDFTLGEDITIPANCVLEFDGGSISGASKVTFADTLIEGAPKILCDYDGALSNDDVDISWFGTKVDDSTFDNAPIIEKVINTFRKGTLSGNKYYVATPIVISDDDELPFNINLDCELIYNGSQNNTVITFDRIYYSNIFISQVNNGSDYPKGCTAIKCKRFSFNDLKVYHIGNFSIGLHLAPINGRGNSSNNISITVLEAKTRYENFIGILLDNTDGWVNDNHFYSCYIAGNIREDTDVTYSSIGIKFVSATYNPSTNTFVAIDTEWCTHSVMFNGGVYNSFVTLRTENCRNIVGVIGTTNQARNNTIELIYRSNSSITLNKIVDADSTSWLWGNFVKELRERVATKNNLASLALPCGGNYYRIPGYYSPGSHVDGTPFESADYCRMLLNDKGVILGWGDSISKIVDSSYNKRFDILAPSQLGTRIFVRYLKKNGVSVTSLVNETLPKIDGNAYYDDGFDAFFLSYDNGDYKTVIIPDDITEVEFIANTFPVDDNALIAFEIYSNGCIAPTKSNNIKVTDDKATITMPPIGQMLFENGIPIWWNGTAWVDATGTPV